MTKFTRIINDKSTTAIVDLTNLSPGMYLVKTRTTTKKIYKQ